MLAYCTICKYPREALENVKRVKSYVDAIIVVYQDEEDEDAIVKDQGVDLVHKEWIDNFSYFRNQYIWRARALGCDWVFTTDTDELPSIELCQSLGRLIEESEDGTRYDSVAFNAHDIIHDRNGEIISSHVSNYYKQMLFKLYPNIQYVRRVHHDLVGHAWKQINAPPALFYEHHRDIEKIQRSAVRNFFIAGGGVDEYTAKWRGLRRITDVHGLTTWDAFHAALRRGNLPTGIKHWIISHRSDNERPNVDCEVRALFHYYFQCLHPEENTGNWRSAPSNPSPRSEIEQFVELEYLRVLGRHGDPVGVANYVRLIENGEIKRDDLERIFRESDEYKQKFGVG